MGEINYDNNGKRFVKDTPPPPPGYGTEKVNIPIAPQLESKFNSEVKISSRMEIYVNIVKVAA